MSNPSAGGQDEHYDPDTWNRLVNFFQSNGGEDIPGLAKHSFPSINLGKQIHEACREVGMILKDHGLYRRNHDLVTVQPDGTMKDMEPKRFCSWVNTFLRFITKNKNGEPKMTDINETYAGLLLHSDELIARLPSIRAVNTVKMPVFRSGGIELLRPGYDRETETFTIDQGLDYPEDIPLAEAKKYLLDTLRHFGWAEANADSDPDRLGRSFGVQIGAMLSVFCKPLLKATSRAPMFVYTANMEGSGKSLLAWMAMFPVHGSANTHAFLTSEEMKKELDAAAIQMTPYLFFDDLYGFIRSNFLNSFLTAKTWAGRLMRTQKQFEVPVNQIAFMTGNSLRLSPDLQRRSLMIDLWCPEGSADRTYPFVLDEDWLLNPKNRSMLLGSLWALVREWAKTPAADRAKLRTMPSFAYWASIVPNIVETMFDINILEAPELEDAGDVFEVEWRKMCQRAVIQYLSDGETQSMQFPLPVLCAICRGSSLFHDQVGDINQAITDMETRRLFEMVEEEDTDAYGDTFMRRRPMTADEKRQKASVWMDRKMSTDFGKQIHRYRGRLFEVNGRQYQFGHRKTGRSFYEIRLVRDITVTP